MGQPNAFTSMSMIRPVISSLPTGAGRPEGVDDHAVRNTQTALDLKAAKPNDLKVRLAKAQLGLGELAGRRQGDPRRRAQGRPRASRGQGCAMRSVSRSGLFETVDGGPRGGFAIG